MYEAKSVLNSGFCLKKMLSVRGAVARSGRRHFASVKLTDEFFDSLGDLMKQDDAVESKPPDTRNTTKNISQQLKRTAVIPQRKVKTQHIAKEEMWNALFTGPDTPMHTSNLDDNCTHSGQTSILAIFKNDGINTKEEEKQAQIPIRQPLIVKGKGRADQLHGRYHEYRSMETNTIVIESDFADKTNEDMNNSLMNDFSGQDTEEETHKHSTSEADIIVLPTRCSIYQAITLFNHIDKTRLIQTIRKYAAQSGVLDQESLELIALELECPYKTTDVKYEFRPPVVAVQGHVDHGKTTLLDALRGSHTVEAGNITQKVSAYPLKLPESNQIVTIFDTPGHEIFSKMRSNISSAADIVLLIVEATSGIQQQTQEVIDLIIEHKLHCVVALNKIDVATDSEIEATKRALSACGLDLNDTVQLVEISAKKKIGLDELEEALCLVHEVADLRCPSDTSAYGFLLEKSMVQGYGAVWNMLIQEGTLHDGDIIVAGLGYGRVSSILESSQDQGTISSAGPSSAVAVKVSISGEQYQPGDNFIVVKDMTMAKKEIQLRSALLDSEKRIQQFQEKEQERKHVKIKKRDLDEDDDDEEEAKVKQQQYTEDVTPDLPEFLSILVSDSVNSLEPLISHVEKLSKIIPADKFSVTIFDSHVGSVTLKHVENAAKFGAQIFSMNSKISDAVESAAISNDVKIHSSDIIYDLTNALNNAYATSIPSIFEEKLVGKATIQQVFPIKLPKEKKRHNVGGLRILSGRIVHPARIVIKRNNEFFDEDLSISLKLFKDEVASVQGKGSECGIMLEKFEDFSENDQIECFEIIHVPTNLKWVEAGLRESEMRKVDYIFESELPGNYGDKKQ